MSLGWDLWVLGLSFLICSPPPTSCMEKWLVSMPCLPWCYGLQTSATMSLGSFFRNLLGIMIFNHVNRKVTNAEIYFIPKIFYYWGGPFFVSTQQVKQIKTSKNKLWKRLGIDRWQICTVTKYPVGSWCAKTQPCLETWQSHRKAELEGNPWEMKQWRATESNRQEWWWWGDGQYQRRKSWWPDGISPLNRRGAETAPMLPGPAWCCLDVSPWIFSYNMCRPSLEFLVLSGFFKKGNLETWKSGKGQWSSNPCQNSLETTR